MSAPLPPFRALLKTAAALVRDQDQDASAKLLALRDALMGSFGVNAFGQRAATFHQLPAAFLEREVRIHVAGCGGNGSQMLTGLARLDRALRSLGHPAGLWVGAFDPDTVSGANVGRQLFYERDIGRNKAAVLIHRLNACYGTAWEACAELYDGRRGVAPDSFGDGAADILITCVDTAKARREIHTAIASKQYRGANWTPLYWLDLGNRQVDGQVVLGQPQDAINRPIAGRLPTVTDLFPELLDETIPEDNRPSCSLAEALESQDLFINDHVSRWALQLLWTLFRKGRIRHHGAFINLDDGVVQPLPVPTPAPVSARADKPRRTRRTA
ncbi:MAG: PRTRC system ThiF family protein [Actinomycetota bacterium]